MAIGKMVRVDGSSVGEICPAKSGWLYQDIPVHNSMISYDLYDDGYNQGLGLLSNPINTNPLHIAKLDFSHAEPFFNLVDINEFGIDKKRFSDELGGQGFANGILIDHLHNRRMTTSMSSSLTYYQQLTAANSFVDALGNNDYRCFNPNEWNTIFNHDILNNRSVLAYSPFNYSAGSFLMSTLTTPQNNGSSLNFNSPAAVFGNTASNRIKATQNCVALYISKHF